MELLQMFYGGEPFSFCLPDEGQIYGVTRQCHSRVRFQKHTHKQQTDELFRMCFVFVGSRLGDSQPACIHDVVWHSRQRAYHMQLILTWRANRDSRKQFFIRNLYVCRFMRTKRDGRRRWLSIEEVSSLAFRLIWSLTADAKTTFETDRFSNSMLLLSSKAVDDSLAPCGSLHYFSSLYKNVWWRCCWESWNDDMRFDISAHCNSAYQTL